MIVIVGHGPSILLGLGAVIDTMTVVRLKLGLRRKFNEKPADPRIWGTRTDYLCARSCIYRDETFWHYDDPPHWVAFYRQFTRRKPSTGLCAVFCAIDRLNPSEIALIGFDRVLTPEDECTGKWNEPRRFRPWAHDQRAEHEALLSLPVKIIKLAREHGRNHNASDLEEERGGSRTALRVG